MRLHSHRRRIDDDIAVVHCFCKFFLVFHVIYRNNAFRAFLSKFFFSTLGPVKEFVLDIEDGYFFCAI